KYIEDALAEEIIRSTIHQGDRIKVDLDEEKQDISIVIEKDVAATQS
ncbi:MAG: hypothetical protein IH599_08485, partial [Bacteroidales bacterium]|nr:hypothetical protein [Bacteroidales bacterium]